MINRRVLEDILQKPLGPYRDRDVLNATECQMKNGRELVLYSFILEHDGQVTGYTSGQFTVQPSNLSDASLLFCFPSLDESERPLDHGPDNRKFRFRGCLKIPDPGWLSEFGLKTVDMELNLRAGERALREGERRPPPLTLKGLFESKILTKSTDSTWDEEDEEEMKLVIHIQGEKNLPAVFMQSTHVPNGLLWSSKADYRNYQIATMDVVTYSCSENFFWQWRLLKLMEKIVAKYSYISIRKRTPNWFVNKYMSDFATPAADKHRRIIYDENDSDVDERGRTQTPRHLLKPHASEVLGLFAAQAHWFVTNGEVRRKKLFDLSSWMKFAHDVRKERKEAAEEGVRWGWPVGMEEEEESGEESGDNAINDVDEIVKQNPVIGKANELVARKIQLAQKRADLQRKQREDLHSDPVESSSGSSGDEGGATYASDFSEQWDAMSSDSDGEDSARAQMPWQLQMPPMLPDVDGRWLCPMDDCKYKIDLHNLTEEDGRGIPQDLVRHIARREWRNVPDDRTVVKGLNMIVTNHYIKHLNEMGLKTDKLRTVRWMDGRRRHRYRDEPVAGPMPPGGTLGGESRVDPIVHLQQ